MAEQRRDAKVAAGFSITAAIAAALAWINTAKAAPGGQFTLPPEFVQLIVAIAASADETDAGVKQIAQELATLGINVQGWPPNVRYTRTFTIICAVVGIAYPANDMTIPSGMNLVIKSHPVNAVGSLVLVATNAADCLNPNSSYPLVPNEPIAYAVQNAKEFFVSSTVAGSIVVFTAEAGG